MEYKSLLEDAYNNIIQKDNLNSASVCGRFEVLNVAGHFEGSRTIITNFLKVSSCIRRSPEHLIKFLSKELATSAELSGDRLILCRKVSSANVNEKVAKYVKCFVTCGKCGKPDTELSEENYKLFLKCLACGNKVEIHKI